jgi:hypothetical protein
MKLYDVPMELETLLMRYETLMQETVGEVTPEVEALELEMAEYFKEGQDKVEAACMVIKNLQADAIAADSEAKRLKLRASSIENNVERLKVLTLSAVKVLGKIKTPRFTIWAQKSKDTVSYSMSPDIMPDVFAAMYPNLSRTVIEFDKKAVQELAKSGAVIPPEVIAEERPGIEFLRIL